MSHALLSGPPQGLMDGCLFPRCSAANYQFAGDAIEAELLPI